PVDVELERAQLAGKLRMAQRKDPSLAGARAASAAVQTVGGLERSPDAERVVEALDCALRTGEAALDDPADMPWLVRQLIACREVDMRELEQRNVFVPEVDVSARGRDQPVEQGRSQDRLLTREGFLEAHALRLTVLRHQAPVV